MSWFELSEHVASVGYCLDVVGGEGQWVFPLGVEVDGFVAEPAWEVVLLGFAPECFSAFHVFGVVAVGSHGALSCCASLSVECMARIPAD